MNLRQFNAAGIEVFRRFLAECRKAPDTAVPFELLTEPALTEEIAPRITVEPRDFSIKRDAAEYLRHVLSPLSDDAVSRNAGLWAWLTLYYFNELCPANDNRRSVKNDYRYIYEPNNPRHFYRHVLFISWEVLRLAPFHNRLFLNSSIARLDKVTEEVMKRLFLTRLPCVFEVLDRLYWDTVGSRVRPNIVDPRKARPGDLRYRFPVRIRQLEMTYDLQSLSADQLIELLGEEFQTLAASTE